MCYLTGSEAAAPRTSAPRTAVKTMNSNAPVTVVELIDLECTACHQSHSAFMDVKKEFGDSVAHLLVHHPLGNHRFAIPAARASEFPPFDRVFSLHRHSGIRLGPPARTADRAVHVELM